MLEKFWVAIYTYVIISIASRQSSSFIFGIPQTHSPSVDYIKVYVSAKQSCQVYINAPGISFTRNFTLNAATTSSVQIPSTTIITNDGISRKSIFVESSEDVEVRVMIRQKDTSDGFLALPITTTSSEFYIASYVPTDSSSQFLISAPYDGTSVSITLKMTSGVIVYDGSTYRNGDTITIALNRFDAFFLHHSYDLTGTHVSSLKPISVVSGNRCSDVPYRSTACDYLIEQMPAVSSWKNEYFTANLKTRRNNRIRIISATDSNTVHITGVSTQTLNKGELYEHVDQHDIVTRIVGSKPVLVIQYSESSAVDGALGDPAMILVPELNSRNNEMYFETPLGFSNYVSITIRTANASRLKLDGIWIDRTDEKRITSSDEEISIIRVQVNNGKHHLRHEETNVRFAAILYGFAEDESYGFPLSWSTRNVVTSVRLVNGSSPNAGIAQVEFGTGVWYSICLHCAVGQVAHAFCQTLGYDKYLLSSRLSSSSGSSSMLSLDGLSCAADLLNTCTIEITSVYSSSCHDGVAVLDCAPSLEEIVTSTCSANNILVEVDMEKLQYRYPGSIATDLYFGNGPCTGMLIGNVLEFNYTINDCSTTTSMTDSEIMHSNQLVYAYHDPKYAFIIRNINWTLDVNCHIARNLSLDSHLTYNQSTSGIQQLNATASYTFRTEFFRDPNFLQQISGEPLNVPIGSNVFVKTFIQNVDWTVEMRLDACYTSTGDTTQSKYYLITNGCAVDVNTHLLSQTDHETKFVFQVFETVGNSYAMNVKCDIIVCDSTNPTSARRCESKPLCT
ncbi:uncharacterized protein LOC128213864 [Mya arenaria]|uniref:uncharacterized protein LOC128213864 n=1 Tax=Mya arenaria TaxID=6604 RepID=UPI0022E87BB6|nr:uncharacterized protein LOC128213864 [Mya arenaria]